MNVSNRNAFFAEVFTRELNRWKQEQNKNQESFAEEIGVEPNMITRYKQGKAYPSEATLARICKVLNVERSVFYPRTLDEKLEYDETFRIRVKHLFAEIEMESISKNNINFFFWEFLWRALPNIKRLLPSSMHDVKKDFLLQKKIGDEYAFFDQSDLDFISDLQNDVVNYIYMQTIKYALGQQLEKGISQAVREKRVPEEEKLDHHWDSVFSIMMQDLLRNPKKEDTNGID